MGVPLYVTLPFFCCFQNSLSLIFCHYNYDTSNITSQGHMSQPDCFSSLPEQLHVDLCLQPWLSKSLPASLQLVFKEICSTCRCIFYMFMGGSKLSIILLCNLVALPQKVTALREKHTVKTKPKKKNHRFPFLQSIKHLWIFQPLR